MARVTPQSRQVDSAVARPLPSPDASASPVSGGDRLTAGQREVISIFVQMAQILGLSRSLGEIYGLLFSTPQPLAFQEIVDRLEISKGSASQGLRFLRTVGAVKPVAVAGDRREFFEPVVELRHLVAGFLRERLNPQIREWSQRAKVLKAGDFNPVALAGPELETLEERLDKLKTWPRRAGTVLPMVGRLLG